MASERWHGAVAPGGRRRCRPGPRTAGVTPGRGCATVRWTVREQLRRGRPLTPIRCRWHDAGVVGVPPHTPGKQAAAAFAPYGLRLQAPGMAPGPVEARITITGRDGGCLGQLDIDAGGAQFRADAISGLLDLHYGAWTSQDADRRRGGHGAGPPT